jgi:hypothetical protein
MVDPSDSGVHELGVTGSSVRTTRRSACEKLA